MDLPNELILVVLAHLPQKDLKQVRLVCKELASLGGQRLIGTIHISPRDEDMDVFDSITRHPHLSKSVKNLFFDTAQFKRCDTMLEYCLNLRRQFVFPDYYELRALNMDVKRVIRLLNCREAYRHSSRTDLIANPEIIEGIDLARCRSDRDFADGYQQYRRHAEQQRNVVSDTWHSRVLQGLKAVGPIDAVTIGNTFDMRIELDEPLPYVPFEQRDSTLNGYQARAKDRGGYDGHRDNVTCHTSHIGINTAECIAGKRSVGSPVARRWPFERLQPIATARAKHSTNEEAVELISRGTSSGTLEFLQLVLLLGETQKQPTYWGIMANDRHIHGIHSSLFSVQWLGGWTSLDLGNRLKVLRLKLVDLDIYGISAKSSLDRLKPIFHDSSALEEITLNLPIEHHYTFSQVFPPVTEWRLSKLRSLNLSSLSTSFRDLVGLFFVNLPSLEDVQLAHIKLNDGEWDPIIEALCRLSKLEKCGLKAFYNPDGSLLKPSSHLSESGSMVDVSDYILQGSRSAFLTPALTDSAVDADLEAVMEALGEMCALHQPGCERADRCSSLIQAISDRFQNRYY
ncbi:MAG: hypothetical protein Q9173_001984 [Seirophora scorigena]